MDEAYALFTFNNGFNGICDEFGDNPILIDRFVTQ